MDTTDMFKVDKLEPAMIAKLFSKIAIDEITGCWNWTGNCNQTGYGRIRYLGPKVLVHRLMFAWLTGAPLSKKIDRNIPILDHICDNKRCCNPSHLRLTTHKINMLKGTGPSAKNARKTHCKYGHLLPEEKNSRGRRPCKICNTIWQRNKYREVHNLSASKFKVF